MDPFPQQEPPGGSGGAKAGIVALVVVVVLGLLGLGIWLVMSAGGDDDADDDDTAEAATVDEGDDADEDEADLDGDGIPDAEDDDVDGDGVPDEEDEAPLDPDVPGDGDDDGDEADRDGDGVPDDEDADPDDPDVGDEDDGDDGDGPGDEGEPDDGDDDEDGDGEEAPGLDLLRNSPQPAIDGGLTAAGQNVKAIEVALYPEYGFATLREPPNGNDVQRWGWRAGVVDGPEDEEPFPGTDLDAEQFRLDRPNWGALPRLVANAPERAGLPRGHVTHVIVSSDLPFSNRKIFRIYVEAPNGSDYVVATIDGQPASR